jgi:hypothetical protein
MRRALAKARDPIRGVIRLAHRIAVALDARMRVVGAHFPADRIAEDAAWARHPIRPDRRAALRDLGMQCFDVIRGDARDLAPTPAWLQTLLNDRLCHRASSALPASPAILFGRQNTADVCLRLRCLVEMVDHSKDQYLL